MTWLIVVYVVISVVSLLMMIGYLRGKKLTFWQWVLIVLSCAALPLNALYAVGKKIIQAGEAYAKK